MTCLQKIRDAKHQRNKYATSEDFQRIFTEDVDHLYQLAFLLTRDHKKAEQTFVAGLEDSVKDNRVLAEWARSWAKRTIIQNAVRELKPRPPGLRRSFSETPLSYFGETLDGKDAYSKLDAVLELEDFDRFVFVMFIVEHYSDHDCALLLNSSRTEIQKARSRALTQLANPRPLLTTALNSAPLLELAR